MHTLTLEEAIKRLPLNALASRLAIQGEIPDRDGKSVRCFFPDRHVRGDQNPSFNFFDHLTRFKCHACGVQGRGPDLVSMALGLDPRESVVRFIAMAGGAAAPTIPAPTKRKVLALPPDATRGTGAQWRALAELRHIHPEAVALASGMGVLLFGTVHGCSSWIVTDQARKLAEARRMDGKLYPAIGRLGERKAHTLQGSSKSWPVGLLPRHSAPERFRKLAIVEGGPDLLAAYHFLLEQEAEDTLPVAILGRECRTIHPDALKLFQGRRMRIYPHADSDKGGLRAAERWSDLIQRAYRIKPDGFNFDGLLRSDDSPATDLNDCTDLRNDHKPALDGLFSYE